MVRDRLETADWNLRREIVCTLIKRVEVTDDVVRVVFRVEPGGSGPPEPRPALRHCLAGRRHAPHVALVHGYAGSRAKSKVLGKQRFLKFAAFSKV